MLPRTTQQSNSAALGRESQIEPWLALGQHAACRREELPRNDANQMLSQSDPRSGAEPCRRRGAGCQKKPSSKKDGKVFFLDIPFYRTRICGGFCSLKAGPPAPPTLRFPERTRVALRSDSRMTIIKTPTSYFACASFVTTAATLSSIWFQPSN